MGGLCGGSSKVVFDDVVQQIAAEQSEHKGADFVDTEIREKYAFDGMLGVGTAGRVYMAYDKNNYREPVAIKLMPKDGSRDWRPFYAREVRALEKLTQPRIITLIEYMQDEFSYIIVTEYCEGGTLLDRIHQADFTERDAADIVIQMIDAVRFCHRKNFVHRDIRPSNFLYQEEVGSEVVLSGFGLAMEVEDDLEYPNRAGTVFFMAPELAQSDRRHPRTGKVLKECDIWALGVTTYIIMCGTYPFGDAHMTNSEIWDSIINDKLVFPSQLPSLTDGFKNFVSMCLRKNPNDRINIEEARSHPWVKGDTASEEKLSASEMDYLVSSLTQMSQQTKLKKNIVHALSRYANPSSEEELRRQFRLIDKNENDELEANELQLLLESVGYAPSQAKLVVEKMLKSSDMDRNRSINFEEFSTQFHRFALQEHEAYTQSVFRLFDGNNDGFISKTELGRVLSISSGQLGEMVREADTDRDDKISYEEFRAAMMEDLDEGVFDMRANTPGVVMED